MSSTRFRTRFQKWSSGQRPMPSSGMSSSDCTSMLLVMMRNRSGTMLNVIRFRSQSRMISTIRSWPSLESVRMIWSMRPCCVDDRGQLVGRCPGPGRRGIADGASLSSVRRKPVTLARSIGSVPGIR